MQRIEHTADELRTRFPLGDAPVDVARAPGREFLRMLDLAASPLYEEVTKTVGEVTVRSYAPGELREGAKHALEAASRALKIFGDRYGTYPYTEFDIVATPNLALGIEYPGITAINSRIYDLNQTIRGTPVVVYLESTVAHETGHQWFYNLVGYDQVDDPWLDESLTQFITLQYYEDHYGASAADGFKQSLDARWSGGL